MLAMLFEMFTEVNEEQSPNASSPMLVTLLGIVMDVRDEHPEKARSPILVILFGIVTAITLGLQSITVSFLMNNPSTSISAILVPQ
jgi:hypothetical protein